MSLESAKSIASDALDRVKKLIEKANETGDYDYVSEAYRTVSQAKQVANQALLDAQSEFMESMGEGETVVEDHYDWHMENLEADSFVMQTIRQAESVCGSYSRNVRVPSTSSRIIPNN